MEKKRKNDFEKIIAKNFSELIKDIDSQNQEVNEPQAV